ncbi:MAG TPA: adenylate/guanylate cyclase domain-containing protein [Stellaceae bacterium]|nr:adenylate/guanylate cyclase domain-containing protein [Stellaceae bacterium]
MTDLAREAGGSVLAGAGGSRAAGAVVDARGLYRRLVWIYIQGSAAAAAVMLTLALLGLDFTARQWGIFLPLIPLAIAFYVAPDIYLIGRQCRPIGNALSAVERGERPNPTQVSLALVRCLNLPFYSFLRLTLLHGPLAAASSFLVMSIANEFGAGAASWQVTMFALAVLLFASPTHAIIEYFSISRTMLGPIARLSAAAPDGILPEHQHRLVAIRLRSKLLYLSICIAAIPLVFFAGSIMFKVGLMGRQLGFAPTPEQMMSLWLWLGGVIAVCLVMALTMATLTAGEVSRSAATLTGAMQRVEAGQLDVDLNVTSTDEYADLFRGFNHMIRRLRDEVRLLEVTQALAGELNLDTLIQRILSAASDLLDAERATLFVYDPKTDELWSRYAAGLDAGEIRIPSHQGIAGAVFTSGHTENIADAYADERFNRGADIHTGYHTRNILCMPIVNKAGARIGVTQVLNKKGDAPFVARDEARLRAFTAQIAVLLENAQLFDEVLSVKNYNESILRSTSNGMVTLDNDGNVVTANEAALAILKVPTVAFVGAPASRFFAGDNAWVMAAVARVAQTGRRDISVDALLKLEEGDVSVNMTVQPLFGPGGERIGSMLVFEDITTEKRVKATMARYMSKEVADQLLESGEAELGGKAQTVTILFSDIRNFTTLSEALGARETVSLLNEYFAVMYDVVTRHGGILDKYIGDAMMALFGAPFGRPHDADNALAVANEMLVGLRAFNRKRREANKQPIDIGVGIATGEVVVGNIGAPARVDYTVIGDSVNLASRLEGANKYYHTKILVDEATVQALTTSPLLREVDLLRVKGKDHPVAVYEALGYHDSENWPTLTKALVAFEEGLSAYRSGDWDGAIGRFEAALRHQAGDPLSLMYIERCRHYRDNPPGRDWGGVWVLTEK